MVKVPFEISIPEEKLNDLRERLASTRWPDELEAVGWDQGTPLAYLKEMTEYWRTSFDWRAQEKALNALPQFVTTIGGLKLHYVHMKGKGTGGKAILLSHGWPSTFFEMSKLVPLLAQGFDVVAPSLPGFGFSEAPKRSGFDSWRIAETFMILMTEVLGYRRFYAHGGDIGSGITTRLGILYPQLLEGIHLLAVADPVRGPESPALTECEAAYVKIRDGWHEPEGAYMHQQRTRPQTLAYGLADSPAGLASWILEKYRAWSGRELTRDELLTNVSLYWFTNTIGSANRLYYENWGPRARRIQEHEKVRVPTAVGITREAVERAPLQWASRLYDVKRWTEYPRGGHFIALEEPELLAADLTEAFR